MNWDPEIYMRFADERTRPAVELLARIPEGAPSHVIDLGCGPGNSTDLLATRWPKAKIEGLEPSGEMLAKARASGVKAKWISGTIEWWSPQERYDVIYSNAALHWIPDHRALVPRLMGYVARGGTLAFQVPQNFGAPSHMLMREAADRGRWAPKLMNARQINVQEPETYYALLAPLSKSIDIWETTYFHVLDGEDPVLEWVSGTGLRPFVQPLEPDERDAFLADYRRRLRDAYPPRPDGKTLFPFKRLFVVATR